ncbi:hypothetical protein FH972_010204 [Carpinus fangiana]|uniref:Uncharacterized protein n=1 Tax=Carpinus fangiana TaxID=176857 RepID=A0A660KPI9_9ROSI|nr:hypothetical protein FH972_010204 [Carpinus fangiana]
MSSSPAHKSSSLTPHPHKLPPTQINNQASSSHTFQPVRHPTPQNPHVKLLTIISLSSSSRSRNLFDWLNRQRSNESTVLLNTLKEVGTVNFSLEVNDVVPTLGTLYDMPITIMTSLSVFSNTVKPLDLSRFKCSITCSVHSKPLKLWQTLT